MPRVVQVMAGCWGGRWLQWEEDPDEDVVTENKQHFSGSAGDVLCLAVSSSGLLATGEPAFETGCVERSRNRQVSDGWHGQAPSGVQAQKPSWCQNDAVDGESAAITDVP